MSTIDAIKEAIGIAGSEAKLGRLTGFSQVAINKAKARGHVSPEMAMRIETATGGKISKSTLRPDLWPDSPSSIPEADAAAATVDPEHAA